jgi:TonB-linked SusC/RagA family outer membrane protein
VAFDPTKPVYVPGSPFGGYFEWVDAEGNPNTRAPRNPVGLLEQTNNTSQVLRSIGNLQLDYRFHFLPELRANLNLGYDISESEGETIVPPTAAAAFIRGGSIGQYAQERRNTLLDFYLNYARDIDAIDSRIDVMAGYSFQDFEIFNPTFPTLSFEGEVINPAPNPTRPQNRLISYFSRANFHIKDRYLLTATIRTDGSSRFAPENRWGVFPALAAAWKINEEAFLRNAGQLSQLKLRLGWGVTGQQDIGADFPFLPRYTWGGPAAQYQLGLGEAGFLTTLRPEGYDRNIKWEETQQYNAGLDFGFAENRLSGSLDYYFKRTYDLLGNVTVPAGTNLTNMITTNVGNIDNYGLEAVLNYNIINTEKVTWNVGLNGTYNRFRITNLSLLEGTEGVGIPTGGIAGGVGNTIQIHSVGYAPSTFFVYQQVYNEQGNPVEGVYVDQNNDGIINELDRYRYQNPEPRFFYGINSQLNYDRWSLGFVLRGNVGNYVYNNVRSANATYANLGFSGYLINLHSNVLETNLQRPQFFSDYYMENASFLRMENINLSYDFGTLIGDRGNLRLSATAQNVFVITNYTGLDPEIPGGIDSNFYPRPRIFSVGVNFGF